MAEGEIDTYTPERHLPSRAEMKRARAAQYEKRLPVRPGVQLLLAYLREHPEVSQLYEIKAGKLAAVPLPAPLIRAILNAYHATLNSREKRLLDELRSAQHADEMHRLLLQAILAGGKK